MIPFTSIFLYILLNYYWNNCWNWLINGISRSEFLRISQSYSSIHLYYIVLNIVIINNDWKQTDQTIDPIENNNLFVYNIILSDGYMPNGQIIIYSTYDLEQ